MIYCYINPCLLLNYIVLIDWYTQSLQMCMCHSINVFPWVLQKQFPGLAWGHWWWTPTKPADPAISLWTAPFRTSLCPLPAMKMIAVYLKHHSANSIYQSALPTRQSSALAGTMSAWTVHRSLSSHRVSCLLQHSWRTNLLIEFHYLDAVIIYLIIFKKHNNNNHTHFIFHSIQSASALCNAEDFLWFYEAKSCFFFFFFRFPWAVLHDPSTNLGSTSKIYISHLWIFRENVPVLQNYLFIFTCNPFFWEGV